ncbi:MAG: protein translocase subunit SecF [Cyanobacteriota bacterium]
MARIGFAGKNIIDIIKYRYLWLGISALIIIPCLGFMIYSMITIGSPVRLGIDFTGGTFLQYGFEKQMNVSDIAEIREVLSKAGQENAVIQIQEPTEILGALSDVNKEKKVDSEEDINADINEEPVIEADSNDDSVKTEEKEPQEGLKDPDKKEEEKDKSNKDKKSDSATKSASNEKKTDVDKTKTADKEVVSENNNKSDKEVKVVEKDVATDKKNKDSKTETVEPDKKTVKEEGKSVNEEKTTKESVTKDADQSLIEAAENQEATTNTLNTSNIKTVVSLRVKFLDDKELKDLNKVLKKNLGDFVVLQVSAIGPSLGKELLNNAMMALLLVFGGIVVYLTIRFQLDYAVCALVTLLHDAIFVIGMFAIFGIFFNTEVDSLFVTAILTAIGFSVHDTIVVFDRVRENARFLSKKKTFNEICNDSVNQTLARSINTSLTAVFVLLCLYFFGGVTTKDFVLAMTLGIAVGTYSSIFVASVLLALWREINAPKKRSKKQEGS